MHVSCVAADKYWVKDASKSSHVAADKYWVKVKDASKSCSS